MSNTHHSDAVLNINVRPALQALKEYRAAFQRLPADLQRVAAELKSSKTGAPLQGLEEAARRQVREVTAQYRTLERELRAIQQSISQRLQVQPKNALLGQLQTQLRAVQAAPTVTGAGLRDMDRLARQLPKAPAPTPAPAAAAGPALTERDGKYWRRDGGGFASRQEIADYQARHGIPVVQGNRLDRLARSQAGVTEARRLGMTNAEIYRTLGGLGPNVQPSQGSSRQISELYAGRGFARSDASLERLNQHLAQLKTQQATATVQNTQSLQASTRANAQQATAATQNAAAQRRAAPPKPAPTPRPAPGAKPPGTPPPLPVPPAQPPRQPPRPPPAPPGQPAQPRGQPPPLPAQKPPTAAQVSRLQLAQARAMPLGAQILQGVTGGYRSETALPIGIELGRIARISALYSAMFQLQDIVQEGIQDFLDYEHALTEVQFAMTRTGQDAGDLTDQVNALAAAAGQEPHLGIEAAARGIRIFGDEVESGQTTARTVGIESARAAMQALVLTGEDLETVQTDLAAVSLDYNLTAGDQARVLDVVQVAYQRFSVNQADVLNGMAALAGEASAAGIPLERLGQQIAIITARTGQSGASAANEYKRILGGLTSDEARSALEAVGVDTIQPVGDQIEELSVKWNGLTLAQQENIRSVLGQRRSGVVLEAVLANHSAILEATNEAYNNAGVATDAYRRKIENIGGVVKRIGGDLQALVQNLIRSGLVDFLGVALRMLEPFVRLLNNAVVAFNNLPGPLNNVIVYLGELAVVMRLLRGTGIAQGVLGLGLGLTGGAGGQASTSAILAGLSGRGGGGLARQLAAAQLQQAAVAGGLNLPRLLAGSGLPLAAGGAAGALPTVRPSTLTQLQRAGGLRGAQLPNWLAAMAGLPAGTTAGGAARLVPGVGRLSQYSVADLTKEGVAARAQAAGRGVGFAGSSGVIAPALLGITAVAAGLYELNEGLGRLTEASELVDTAMRRAAGATTAGELRRAAGEAGSGADRLEGLKYDGASFWARMLGDTQTNPLVRTLGGLPLKLLADNFGYQGGTKAIDTQIAVGRSQEQQLSDRAKEVDAAQRLAARTGAPSVFGAGGPASIEEVDAAFKRLQVQGYSSAASLNQFVAALNATSASAKQGARAVILPGAEQLWLGDLSAKTKTALTTTFKGLGVGGVEQALADPGFATALQSAQGQASAYIQANAKRGPSGELLLSPEQVDQLAEVYYQAYVGAGKLPEGQTDEEKRKIKDSFNKNFHAYLGTEFSKLILSAGEGSPFATDPDVVSQSYTQIVGPQLQQLGAQILASFGSQTLATREQLRGFRDWLDSLAPSIRKNLDPQIQAAYDELQRTDRENTQKLAVESIDPRDTLGRASQTTQNAAENARRAARSAREGARKARENQAVLIQGRATRDAAIKAANDAYKADLAYAEGSYGTGTLEHPFLSAQGGNALEAAKKRRDDAIKAARDTYTQLQAANPDVSEADYQVLVEEARIAERDARIAERRERIATENSRASAQVFPGSRIQETQVGLANARRVLDGEIPKTHAWWDAYGQVQQAKEAVAQAESDAALAAVRNRIDISDPLAVTRAELNQARATLARHRAAGAPQDVLDQDTDRVRQLVLTDRQNAFERRLRDTQHAHDMGRLSDTAYLAFLNQQGDTLRTQMRAMNHNSLGYRQAKEQLQEIEKEIKGFQDSVEGQYNIGNIKLPTIYEVRRAVQSQAAGLAYAPQRTSHVTVNINGDSVANIQRAVLGAIEGDLTQGLGATGGYRRKVG